MTWAQATILFAAATLAGALNAIAGGGSFLTFPSLLFAGLGPIQANATSTVALWPGSIASAVGYRDALKVGSMGWLSVVSLVGGVLGALLLVRTPPSIFLKLLPFLLLIATVAFTFGGNRRPLGKGAHLSSGLGIAAQFLISIYGGYFGGGMGLMMLGLFVVLGMSDIHAMNGLKSLLAVLINAAAIVTFAVSGNVRWALALLMVAGASIGGLGGSLLAQKVRPMWIRRGVVAIGWILTAYFFIRLL